MSAGFWNSDLPFALLALCFVVFIVVPEIWKRIK